MQRAGFPCVGKIIYLTVLFAAVSGCASNRKPHDPKALPLSLADLPESVQAHFHRDHPTVAVQWIEKENVDGVVHYDVQYTQPGDEKPVMAVYNREGDEIKSN